MIAAAHEIQQKMRAQQRLPVWQAFLFGAKRKELVIHIKDLHENRRPPHIDIDVLRASVSRRWQSAFSTGSTQTSSYLPVVLPSRLSQGNGNTLFKRWLCGSGLGASVGKGSQGDFVKVNVDVILPYGVALSEADEWGLQESVVQHLNGIAGVSQADILDHALHVGVVNNDTSTVVFVICPFNTLQEADMFHDSVNSVGNFQGNPMLATYNKNKPEATRQVPEK